MKELLEQLYKDCTKKGTITPHFMRIPESMAIEMEKKMGSCSFKNWLSDDIDEMLNA